MPYVYDSDFMDYTNESSRYSATKTIAALSKSMSLRSVLDVGCARGTWLKAWSDAGVGDFFGVDGDYIDTAKLNISRDRFLATDLSKPFDLRRTFELVQSLELPNTFRFSRRTVSSKIWFGTVMESFSFRPLRPDKAENFTSMNNRTTIGGKNSDVTATRLTTISALC